MRNALGPLVAANMVTHRTQAQVHGNPVPRREVAVGGMHEAGVKNDHRARRPLRRQDDGALLATRTRHELRDERAVNRPQRVAVAVMSCLASTTPRLWPPGMNINGPSKAFTSSRKMATFMARSVGIKSSLRQVP